MTAAKNLDMAEISQGDHLRALAELQSLGPSGDELVLHAVEGLSDRKDKLKRGKNVKPAKELDS